MSMLREHTGPLAAVLTATVVASMLLGLWQVREETGLAIPVDALIPQSLEPRLSTTLKEAALALKAPDDWAWIAPDEAVDFFNSLVPMTSAQWEALDSYGRAVSWTIAGAQEQLVVRTARDAIAESLASGKARREAVKDLAARLDAAGFAPANPHHVGLVFDQAVATSQNAGRYRAQRSEGAATYLPWWIYETMGDDRVRDEHAILHGFSAMTTDPIWDSLYPPNGFRCRCMAVADRRPSDKGEFPSAFKMYADEIPEPGFAVNPAAQMNKLAGAGALI